MKNPELLIIDDEPNMCHMLKAMVGRHGYRVTTASDGQQGLDLIKQKRFDFILCDVKMPVMDGLQFLERGKDNLNDSTVIMMSAFGSVDLAIDAMKAGAYDFISKPFKTDEVLLVLKKAEEREQLRLENEKLRAQIARMTAGDNFPDMVAVSSEMKKVLALSVRVAQFDTTVLITGESGTGKELIAHGIHRNSPRKDNAFVAVNCGSLPENLLESELFGHARGAFTGAVVANKGLFREAQGGTIFLDEISELPIAMQVKLLRVLQEQEIRSVGSTTSTKVDVRVIAATAKELENQVGKKTFREDLFYRLNVVRVRIPPLRDRKEDIDHLCTHFIGIFKDAFHKDIRGFSEEADRLMKRYDWPGNVRELENLVQRGMVVTDGQVIDVGHLPDRLRGSPKLKNDKLHIDGLSLKKGQRRLEASLIAKALEVCKGNKSCAAEKLEISYPSLLQKIKLYEL